MLAPMTAKVRQSVGHGVKSTPCRPRVPTRRAATGNARTSIRSTQVNLGQLRSTLKKYFRVFCVVRGYSLSLNRSAGLRARPIARSCARSRFDFDFGPGSFRFMIAMRGFGPWRLPNHGQGRQIVVQCPQNTFKTHKKTCPKNLLGPCTICHRTVTIHV